MVHDAARPLGLQPVRIDVKPERLELVYPDESTVTGRSALVGGLCEVHARDTFAEVTTFADVELVQQGDLVELAFAARRLRYAVHAACDRLERAGDVATACELREAAILAGFPPSEWNPLAP